MKHSKKSFINVHPLTYIYLILSLFVGRIEIYFYSLFIVVIHETAHYMIAKYFCFEIDRMTILPFGAYLRLKDMYLHDIKEELCVILAGPSTHLFLYYVILILCDGDRQDYLLTFNSFIFIFNLIPIYPMDGHRIISLLMQSVFDLKKALYLSMKLSIFCLCLLSLFYFALETFVMIVYLATSQIQYYKDIPQSLRYVYSHITDHHRYKRKIIHRAYHYRRGYQNYYLLNDKTYNEKDVVFEVLKNIKNI